MNLGAFWRVVRDVDDLDGTAKLALIVMTAYIDGREGDTAIISQPQFMTALSLSEHATVQAIARVVENGWAEVVNPVGKAWHCTLSDRLVARRHGVDARVDPVSTRALAQNLADRAVLSLKEELKRKEAANDAAAPIGASSPPVDNENRSGHRVGCRCGGTGWLEVSPGEAVRCAGLRVVE